MHRVALRLIDTMMILVWCIQGICRVIDGSWGFVRLKNYRQSLQNGIRNEIKDCITTSQVAP